jgi:hypothetical protein
VDVVKLCPFVSRSTRSSWEAAWILVKTARYPLQ